MGWIQQVSAVAGTGTIQRTGTTPWLRGITGTCGRCGSMLSPCAQEIAICWQSEPCWQWTGRQRESSLPRRKPSSIRSHQSQCLRHELILIFLRGLAAASRRIACCASPLVVDFAPQLELLQRATLTINHAGLNTVLESLRCGVPMVAIPIANDQPGVAARVFWSGSGTVQRLRSAINQVWPDSSYRQNARHLQKAIAAAGGVSRAAEIVEQAISSGQPVLR